MKNLISWSVLIIGTLFTIVVNLAFANEIQTVGLSYRTIYTGLFALITITLTTITWKGKAL